MNAPNPYERINARLDDESARQLGELTTGTGKSVSLVVREAIAAYHAQVIRPRRPSRFLALMGSGDSGRSDVSANVKHHVAQIVDEKFARSHLVSAPAGAAPAAGEPRVRRRR
jgi:hypothetical protein